jgi:hypothetical protein
MLGLTSRTALARPLMGWAAPLPATRPASRMQLRATAEAKTESKKKKKGKCARSLGFNRHNLACRPR